MFRPLGGGLGGRWKEGEMCPARLAAPGLGRLSEGCRGLAVAGVATGVSPVRAPAGDVDAGWLGWPGWLPRAWCHGLDLHGDRPQSFIAVD